MEVADMHEAMFYETVGGATVRCRLCNQRCKIEESDRGLCGVRENREGKLYSLVYGKIIAEHIDPIEKKPLFHFLPGSTAYSIGTVGCNFHCLHCQNADISQYSRGQRVPGKDRTPADIVEEAKASGCRTIAYTYTEPTIFYEIAYDTAVQAQKEGLKNVFVSNGYISVEPMRHIAPYLDAINVDLKGFSDSFYQEVCGARLKPVLRTIQLAKELGLWLEVTTLLIPRLNDSEDELRSIARFLTSVGAEVPWHISRFHPAYQLLDRPPTPLATLKDARKIGLEEGLRYVYLGNVPTTEGESTYCHSCGSLLVKRSGSLRIENYVVDGCCPQCGMAVHGVFKEKVHKSRSSK
jgi:pyruvate formate lyase activating enzyme